MFSSTRLLEKVAKIVRPMYDNTGSYIGGYNETGTYEDDAGTRAAASLKRMTQQAKSGYNSGARAAADLKKRAEQTKEGYEAGVKAAAADLKKRTLRARHQSRVSEIKKRSGGNPVLEARWHKQWKDKQDRTAGRTSPTAADRAKDIITKREGSSTSSAAVKKELGGRSTGTSSALQQRIIKDALKGN